MREGVSTAGQHMSQENDQPMGRDARMGGRTTTSRSSMKIPVKSAHREAQGDALVERESSMCFVQNIHIKEYFKC